jgi:nicotinamidase-related amidase
MPAVYTKITPLPASYESGWRLYMMMKRYGGWMTLINCRSSCRQEARKQKFTMRSDLQKEMRSFSKHTANIFIGTHFENMMRNRGIKTVLFTGVATEMGIDSSVRDSGG